MVSSESEQTDLLRAFEAGADDFMDSPPSYLELRARLRAILRRTKGPASHPVIQVGPLRIDTAAHAATLHEKCLDLRTMEYDLLVHLAGSPPASSAHLNYCERSGATRSLAAPVPFTATPVACAASSTPSAGNGLSTSTGWGIG